MRIRGLDRNLRRNGGAQMSLTQRAINILKSAGPGAWYDPSDLTTLFQDSAGTTPVTAVEQPVGRILDKSKGLVLGAELFTGSYFVGAATTATYVGNEATATFAGALTSTAGNWLSIPGAAAENVYSEAEFWATWVSGGDLQYGRTWAAAQTITAASNAGVRTRYKATAFSPDARAEAGRATFGSTTAGSVWKVELISVREITGAHLIQPTATSRPTLSSRYNLLTKTEQFDDAAWPKTNMAIAPNATTAPDGTLTADTATASLHPSTSISLQRGMSANAHTFSVFAKASSVSVFRLDLVTAAYATGAACQFNLSAGTAGAVTNFGATVGSTASIVSVGYGWYRCSITVTTTATNHFIQLYPDANGSVHIWGASLVPASDAALPYQRVNTATDYDYDFSKFPAYLKFDGVDDSLYTAASVDFTTTDKMTVFAGVHKASDAATAALVELSANATTTNGAFVLGAPFGTGTATYDQYVRGTAVSGVALGSTPAPTTNVITAVGDIAGDLNRVTKNGTTSNQIGGDLGTGNFGNHVLNVGRRNNASLPFNGRLYQLALKGKAMTAAEIATVESFVNSKTKAFV